MAKLVFRSGMYVGKNMSLPEGKAIVLGRNRDVDLPLNDAKLSRRHCQITATKDGVIISDLSSTNGTFVNGNRIEAGLQMELIEFDRIALGDIEIELYLSEHGERNPAVSSDDNLPVIVLNSQSQALSEAIQSPAPEPTKTFEYDDELGSDGEPELSTDSDTLLAALYEMDLQLPPEPPLNNGSTTSKNEPVYCSYCGSKIPEADRSSGEAHVVEEKMACKACVSNLPLPPEFSDEPEVDTVLAMLSGLDEEPVVVDTSKRQRLTVVEHDAEEDRKWRQKALVKPPQKPVEEPEKQAVFGDEFEEIG